jgi:hypothetical protein
MTVQDIIDELSDHGFVDTSVTRKMWMINDTVYDICSRSPWPFLEKTIDLTFDGTNPYPSNFPSDFRAVIDLYDPVTGVNLQPLRLDQADKTYGSYLATGGNPIAYYFLDGQLRVFNIPGSTQVLRISYVAEHPLLVQTDVEATILIPKYHHRAIVMGALWKLYDMEDDPELAVRFEQHYENRINTMRDDIWMKQFDRPDRIYVLDDDDQNGNWWT